MYKKATIQTLTKRKVGPKLHQIHNQISTTRNQNSQINPFS
jgi:hypothetical protein